MRLPFLIAAALSAPASALAQPPAADPPAARPAEAKKLCRRSTPPVGSVMPGKRICRTAAEWAALDRTNTGAGDRARAAFGNTGMAIGGMGGNAP